MLKHVLVTLDGSQLAEEALVYARQIVDSEGTITLLSVVDVPDLPMYNFYLAPVPARDEISSETINSMLSQTKDYLIKIASQLRQDGFTVKTEIKVGEPAKVIVERAEECCVDAIVISTHGRSGFSRWLFGSVTQKVLSIMPCPVFVVPGNKHLMDKEQPAKETITEN